MSDYRFIDKPRTTCALGGVLAAVAALPEVIPIIHTATGCGGNLANAVAFGAGYQGGSYCSGNAAPASGISETEIVFGGHERLREQIESTLKLIDGKLFIVATGCMTEMIGDDVQGVVSEFAGAGKPVVAVSTPSFKGDNYAGYEILLDGIFNKYLPVSAEKDKKLINVFGVAPGFDPFFRGDLEEIERLAAKLGLKVNTFFTPSQTYENVLSAPKAALNVVLSRTLLADFSKAYEQKHSAPAWATDLPIGPEATDAFLFALAEKTGVDRTVAEKAVAEENAWYYRYFERTADSYSDGELRFYAVTVTNSNYAAPLTKYLYRELGWIPLDVFVTNPLTGEQRENVRRALSQVPVSVTFEGATSQIAKAITRNHPENRGQRYFESLTPLFIAGSTFEKQTAAKRNARYLSVSFPAYDRAVVSGGYAGYRGGLRLYEDLIGAVMGLKS
jgi:nitrogenase molybdenum-iron protein beta chain